MKFDQLNLIEPLLKAIHKKGYLVPTPIQEQAIPTILRGRDIFGCAQTGTGKTAAFVLPILQLMSEDRISGPRRPIRALVLAPTRELAAQIGAEIADYTAFLPLKHRVIYGGVSQNPQLQDLKQGVDILVATPGRLLDLIQQGFIHLNSIEYFVLDEADRMLDMGFIHDVRKIITKLPVNRKTMLFSATLPEDIRALAATLLSNPVQLLISPPASTPRMVHQRVYHVEKENKKLLLAYVLKDADVTRALVFTRTKRGADRVARDLYRNGILAEAIHGDKSQNARERALFAFKNNNIRVLVATDIASRGIDVEKLSHVINYEIPAESETYVHRIGRTGRAGHDGVALSFCSENERPYLNNIHKKIKQHIFVVDEHPFI